MHVRSFCTVVLVALLAHCTVAEDLNVFLIPHSHCDPGWLNTFEGYFRDQVHRILNSVTEQLITDSTKKFVWAEISFFQLWYEQQSQDTRDGVKTLVKNGQLEFVAGGWVQNDEANANFDIVIDQVTEGHDFLHRVFGVVPRIAWQIDPFGHSSLTPSLFARMGFEALVINRIHFGLKASFKDNKNMEFLWTGSQSLGNASQLFTHVLHTHYSAPQGFDFEDGNPAISPNNAAGRARDLAETLKRRAHAYRTNNLLVPFGDDFKFQNAPYQFSNMDQLIAEINARRDYGVKIKYATVSEYFDAVSAASKKNDIKFPTYSGDFFPYADNDDSYWTGYYTTRPGLKSHSRGTDSILRAAEGMYALGRMVGAKDERFATIDWDTHFDGLRQGRRNAALVQHHDGITGTAKQFVANDYAQRLDQARSASHTTMKEMAQILLTDKETPSLTYDLRTFSFDLGDEVYGIVVHNPLGWIRRKYVKVRVTSPEVVVMSHDGVNLVGTQVLPVIDINSLSPAISEYELYFLVEVPPLGTKTYFLAKSASANSHPDSSQFTGYQKTFGNASRVHNAPKINTASKVNPLGASSKIEIENEHYVVKFHGDTGLIASVYNKDKKAEVVLNQEIADYRTSRSGAYIMRPERQGPTYTETTPIKLAHITGPTVSQVCTYFFARPEDQAYETSVCVRLFSTRGITNTPNILEVGGYLEVVYSVVGRRNCETVVRFNTDLNTNRIFYTDNGLEIRERRSEGTRTENHYFPNLSLAYLQDVAKGIQFTILSRQAMGTHSRDNGVIEQMVHRALGQDDGRGLGEPNNDQSRIEVVVYLLVQPIEPSVRMARRLALALQHQPRLLHTEARGGPKAWATKYKPYYYPFVSQLPHNIHLLTFKARDSITDDIILRLIHIYEVGQHNQWSQPKELEWDRIFQEFTFDSKRERSLAMSLDMPALRNRKAVTVFLPSTETLNHASGVPPAFVKQENQNTEEEGVFISQAALDDKKKTEEETAKNQNPGGRTLQALTFTPEDTSLILAPMQIKSYFVQLVPKTTKAEPIPTIPPNKQLPPAETRATVPPKKPPQQRTTPKPKPIEKTNDSKEPPQGEKEEEEQTQVLDEDEGPVVIETNNGATMSNAQVSDVELRTFFLISIVGTGLVVLAYWRLRQRRNGKSSFTLMKRKGLIEV